MAKVTYIAPEGASPFVKAFGVNFLDKEPKEITDEKALSKFRNNRFFKVEDAKPPAQSKVTPNHENKP